MSISKFVNTIIKVSILGGIMLLVAKSAGLSKETSLILTVVCAMTYLLDTYVEDHIDNLKKELFSKVEGLKKHG